MSKKMYISFVLDETGSMQSCKQQTISGFNEYIKTLKDEKNSKDMIFTLTKFNSEKIDVVFDGVKINKVVPLSDETYQPNAMTPLYDAIGKTIRSLEASINSKKQSVLVVIQTDGEENYSKEYDSKDIFSLIDEKKKSGWTFAFLGADQDAWIASQRMGISRGNTMSYNSNETAQTFTAVAAASVNYARHGGKQTANLFDADDKTA